MRRPLFGLLFGFTLGHRFEIPDGALHRKGLVVGGTLRLQEFVNRFLPVKALGYLLQEGFKIGVELSPLYRFGHFPFKVVSEEPLDEIYTPSAVYVNGGPNRLKNVGVDRGAILSALELFAFAHPYKLGKFPLLGQTGEKLLRYEVVVVGIDAIDGMVAVEGWGELSNMKATDLAKEFANAGVEAIICTDVGRDGMMTGVNVEFTLDIARASGVATIASGGVKDFSDLIMLKNTNKIFGSIIGKAFYEGTLDLEKAFKDIRN